MPMLHKSHPLTARRAPLLLALGLASLAGFAHPNPALAQPSGVGPLTPPANGPRRADPTWAALVHCHIYAKPGDPGEVGTVVFRDGLITAVLKGDAAQRLPLGPRIIDGDGLHVYPAFVESYAEIDVPAPAADAPGAHWNASVTPHRRALQTLLPASTADGLRKVGFAAAAIAPKGGIFRGTAAVVSLAKPADDQSADRPAVYRDNVYQSMAFDLGARGYPGSQMGAIALIRQTFADADWWAAEKDRAKAAAASLGASCLDALAPGGGAHLFNVESEVEALRALRIAREFGRSPLILGSGTEYRRIDALRDANAPFIIPLNFPKAPDVSSVAKAQSVDLRDLMGWEQAPTNPRRMEQAGLAFALTSSKLKDRAELWKNLRTAVAYGLTEERALAALTTTPAALLGVADQVGTIEPGKRANLLIMDGPWLKPASKIRTMVVDGVSHEINAAPTGMAGDWLITLDAPAKPDEAEVVLTISKGGEVTVSQGKTTAKATRVQLDARRVAFVLSGPIGNILANKDAPANENKNEVTVLSAGVERERGPREALAPSRLNGQGIATDGTPFTWTATKREASPFVGVWKVNQTDGAPVKPPEQPGNDNNDDGLVISITSSAVTLTFTKGEEKTVIEAKDVVIKGDELTFTHDLKKLGGEGVSSDVVTLQPNGEGPADDQITGVSTLPDASTHTYAAVRQEGEDQDQAAKLEAAAAAETPDELGLPFGPYQRADIPEQRDIVIVGVTLWTNTEDGVIKNGAMYVAGGIIRFVGTADAWSDLASRARFEKPFEVINAEGKHLTPGIIDAHSHTGISKGVNEGGQAITSEVRIGDVTDPDDVNWYRQLAGGVTTVLSLHGSANAIGGQSQTNKLRWGVKAPDAMHFEGAKPGIKFALGENPRQVNFSRGGTRYPQTRMGVEQLIRDRFTAAREYAAARVNPNARRDLELDALAEILAGDRLVHAHSYRQDEMLMLCLVAKDFGFRIGTFQHALEGYKIAEYVKDYSGGASGFTDWWAFKVEVQDAIPAAFPIMHDVGATASFNSDSSELARRLNLEAAKAVKYGGLSDEEALKFVTLNPAKQLGIDERVGSLASGKDADFVIWTDEPLSSFALTESTYIDGRRYFSIEEDRQHRADIAQQRQRLLQKALKENKKDSKKAKTAPGDNTNPASPGRRPRPTDELLARQQYYLDLHLQGKEENQQRGECGCGWIH